MRRRQRITTPGQTDTQQGGERFSGQQGAGAEAEGRLPTTRRRLQRGRRLWVTSNVSPDSEMLGFFISLKRAPGSRKPTTYNPPPPFILNERSRGGCFPNTTPTSPSHTCPPRPLSLSTSTCKTPRGAGPEAARGSVPSTAPRPRPLGEGGLP